MVDTESFKTQHICNGHVSLHCAALGELVPYQQNCRGIVVGFLGSYAFCLNGQEMRRVGLNHTIAVQQHINRGDIRSAYTIACLGASSDDWQQLGFECLFRGDLRFARKSFQHQGNIRFICLLNIIEDELKTLGLPTELQNHVCRAYAYAALKDFDAAAEEWSKAGLPHRSYEMFSELRK